MVGEDLSDPARPAVAALAVDPHAAGACAAGALVRLLGVTIDVQAEMVACIWGGQLEATLTDAKALLTRRSYMTLVKIGLRARAVLGRDAQVATMVRTFAM